MTRNVFPLGELQIKVLIFGFEKGNPVLIVSVNGAENCRLKRRLGFWFKMTDKIKEDKGVRVNAEEQSMFDVVWQGECMKWGVNEKTQFEST